MDSHRMRETGDEPYFYGNHTWKELREVPAERRVVLLPVGSTEDHGHHLPLDTDKYLIGAEPVRARHRGRSGTPDLSPRNLDSGDATFISCAGSAQGRRIMPSGK